jgi:NTP pyrophosphatase (non-canonical NTP hydrolase)
VAAYAAAAADVFIALLNYANVRGVDLGRAVEVKMAEVERRRAARPGLSG